MASYEIPKGIAASKADENAHVCAHMFIVVGPSGTGKSTLLGHLMDVRKSCGMSRSTTTRAPRGTEVNGVEYDFVDIPTFEKTSEHTDAELTALTAHAFRIYSLAFLMSGFNIYGSDFFTALNNGKISAAISFIRTVILEMSAVMLLPLAFGMDGIWIALPIAEALALIVTAQFLIRKRHVYHYA